MLRSVPSAFLLLLVLLAVPAVAVAAGPSLTATVVPGHEIDLVGTGFPASTTVTLTITRTGPCAITPCDPHAGSGTRTVTSDANGGFTATIGAGPGRGGQYAIVATAGGVSASVDVVAVETAGGLAGGAKGTLPPTDRAPEPAPAGTGAGLPLAALLALGIGGLLGAGWTVARTARSRSSGS